MNDRHSVSGDVMDRVQCTTCAGGKENRHRSPFVFLSLDFLFFFLLHSPYFINFLVMMATSENLGLIITDKTSSADCCFCSILFFFLFFSPRHRDFLFCIFFPHSASIDAQLIETAAGHRLICSWFGLRCLPDFLVWLGIPWLVVSSGWVTAFAFCVASLIHRSVVG